MEATNVLGVYTTCIIPSTNLSYGDFVAASKTAGWTPSLLLTSSACEVQTV